MDRDTAEIARKFASRIRKDFAPERIILFGSRARGDNFKTSDFDFIIVSSRFGGVPFLERLSKIYDYWSESVDIEAICYTPEEFERKSTEHGIVRRALEEGVAI